MIVGMMPPKLVQMMLNISDSNPDTSILYDPFCGLGTTLIEGAQMGYYTLLGSDLSSDMVESTTESMKHFIAEELVWQDRIKKAGGTPKRDFSKLETRFWQMDARNIGTMERFFPFEKNTNLTIVSE